jgi:hypothetical protein
MLTELLKIKIYNFVSQKNEIKLYEILVIIQTNIQ